MRRAPLFALGLLATVVLGAGPVRAQQTAGVTVDEAGWWSSQPTALAQPGQGFQVAAGPQGGAESVAAIRLTIAASHVDNLQVRLVEASGGTVGAELGTLRVCTTTATWTAANPGKLTDAPTADCTTAANLTRTTDGSWLGDLTALAPDGGTVSLVILPLYQPPVPVGPGMIVTISAGEFTAAGSGSPSTTDTAYDPGGGAGSNPTTDLYGSFGGGSIGGDFGGGSLDVPPAAAGADGSTTTVPPSTTPTTQGSDDFALVPVASSGGSSRPWVRLVVLIPLCAAFGVGTVQARRRLASVGWSAAA